MSSDKLELSLDTELMLQASEVIVDLRIANRLLRTHNEQLNKDNIKLSKANKDNDFFWTILFSVVVPCVLILGVGAGFAIGSATN